MGPNKSKIGGEGVEVVTGRRKFGGGMSYGGDTIAGC
jgi:hypothetical protein